ncbi:MAG: hypothetical protein ACJAVY_001827 [Marinoscillum sp.]|jgi:hypothetical protein
MDNIQFWLYLAFGAIYFITRMMKKKKTTEDGELEERSSTAPKPRPLTFEELLKEFTQQEGSSEQVKEEKVLAIDKQERAKEDWKRKKSPSTFEEGKTRVFSDDESKRIYQESVKRAEGAKLDFERDEHFDPKIERIQVAEESRSVAMDIREMLADTEQAKRAVILGEILNRKY